MQAMRLADEDGRELDGRIEIDDAYLGGELSGGRTGRGAENKVPLRRGGADHRGRPPAVRLLESAAADPASDGGVCRQPHRPVGHRRQ